MSAPLPAVQVRYIVSDVNAAITFYCQHLGFHEELQALPHFAMLSRGALRLVLTKPKDGPAGDQVMPGRPVPEPGGWNRFAIHVANLEKTVDSLRRAGTRFRNEIVTAVGGKHVLIEDPSGNPVELFEPTIPEARLEPILADPPSGKRRPRPC